MEMTIGPMFTLYVVWHPSYREGQQIADLLRTHFGRNLYRAVGEERAVSVLERSQPVPGTLTPLPIDWDDSEFAAGVVLAEATLIENREWAGYTCAPSGKPRTCAGFRPGIVTLNARASFGVACRDANHLILTPSISA